MRSEFGNIRTRKNRRGEAVSLSARYKNPLSGAEITKRFPLGAKAMAQAWLDAEEKYRDECFRDHIQWLTPKEREVTESRNEVIFSDYADDFLQHYRASDGSKLVESSMRKKRESVDHLDRFFGEMQVEAISEEDVNRWYDGFDEGVHAQRRAYQTLKAIFRKAVSEGIVKKSPCIRPNPKLPKSEQSMIPEATQDELRAMYEAMPEYSRIAIYLGAVFGLRISEVCALQRRDLDFKHGVLHVRHSLARGEGDVGELRLKATKTESSNADLPIPDAFVPMLKAHLKSYCDKGAEAMVIRPQRGDILAPISLREQFDKAKEAAGRPDLHFHTLRATAITAASRIGTPKEAQLYGRHADAKVSLQLYQRANDKGERRVADKVFDSLVAPERTPELVMAELEQAEKRLRDAEADVTKLKTELAGLE
ncbi:tyrosine-type recombinase/integrase [Bifidobacterium sp. ESL0682]|uniref:tyrosine-type recombinase/integrase n=1 Tax=Bifidobacterium sp. ESL0682 TaxID=2983212 RepID=UPI0023F6DC87|nr:tyrosine-type recombinase/integrase [Bifidobacterium sp. ESL0682]WEV42308.1 tyrosine-type recombinase/integrase [Bifidobacterium sp. ESL0682]